MKFKIIQNDSIKLFEEELEYFCESVEVSNIEFKSVCLAPDPEVGLNTELAYIALVTYK